MEINLRRVYGLAVFSLALFWFVAGLAPGLTFEDSGELATAAYLWGVPHPPGYSMWTILAAIWIRIFGAFEPVWATNLLSAVLAALAALVTACIAETWKARLFPKFINYVTGFLAAAFLCVSPHFYRQSVITEVYSLHILVWALFFLQISYYWFAENRIAAVKSLFWSALLVGIGQTVHNLSILLIPLALGSVAAAKLRWLSPRIFLGCIACALVGMLPILYLPIAARADLGFTWGDPSNLQALWAHLARGQYSYSFWREPSLLLEQVRQQVIFIFEQYYFELIFGALVSLSFLFAQRTATGLFWILYLVVSGPLTAVIVNFGLNFSSQFAFQDATSLASVFYLQHYLFWSILIALLPAAIYAGNTKISRSISLLCLCVLFFLGAKIGRSTYLEESKHEHRLTEELVQNLEKLVAQSRRPTVLLVNWDPFSFPLLYAQEVQKRFSRSIVLDAEMLKAPWYQRYLARRHEEVQHSLGSTFEKYKRDFASGGNRVDGKMVTNLYDQLSIFVREISESHDVYIAVWRGNPLPFDLPEEFEIPSAGPAAAFSRQSEKFSALCPEDLTINPPGPPAQIKFDRVNLMIISYYGNLLLDMARENRVCDQNAIRAKLERLAPFSADLEKELRKLPHL